MNFTVIVHFFGFSAKSFRVETVQQASHMMRQFISENNLGASDANHLNGQLFGEDGMRVGTVSYNGRVWKLDKTEWSTAA